MIEPTDEYVARAQAGWAEAEARQAQRDPSLGSYLNHDEKRAHEERLDRIMENHRLAQEAALQTAKLKSGGPIPPPMAPADSIKLEFAMASDTATVRLE